MSAGGMNARKRSLSPEHLSSHQRKSKLARIDFEEENENTNKENLDMVLIKHSFSTCTTTTEDEEDEGIAHSSSSSLPWYHSNALWSNLLTKTYDQIYKSHPNFLDTHPAITTKMRSVLCDWLIEVCEVYHLHRETYHLALAYIDQYLSNTTNLPKSKLQLLGITSLFIAAKIEEIYPPRISEFAYVTDKAYYEGDILDMELEIMNILNWYINPMTSISWLSAYLQLECELEVLNKSSSSSSSSTNVTPSHHDRSIKKRRLSLSSLPKISSNSDFLQTSVLTNVHRTPMFIQTFNRVVRLIDFCSLDIEYSQFPKNILVATALLLCKPNWPVEQLTALNDEDLYICNEWMKPFYEVLYYGQNLHANPMPAARQGPSVPLEEIYSIQIHNISLDLLENVYKKRPKFLPSNRPLSNLVNRFSWLPTPPTSLEKQQHEAILTADEQIQITEVISIVR